MVQKIFVSLIIGVFTMASLTSVAQAEPDKGKLDRLIKKLTLYVDEVQDDPSTRIPQSLIDKAEGIIIMKTFKAGFVLGFKGGGGVAMARDKDGNWSPPSFVSIGEGSVGFQIGGQAMDTILLIMNQEGMKVLSNTGVRIGVEASATAGPVGADAEAKYEESNTPILVYGDTKGLFAGASIEGGALFPHDKRNAIYYGDPSLTMKDIIFDREVTHTAAADELIASLKK